MRLIDDKKTYHSELLLLLFLVDIRLGWELICTD